MYKESVIIKKSDIHSDKPEEVTHIFRKQRNAPTIVLGGSRGRGNGCSAVLHYTLNRLLRGMVVALGELCSIAAVHGKS